MQPARRSILITLLAVGIFLFAGGWIAVGDVRSPTPERYVEAVVGQPTRVNPLAPRANDVEGDLLALVFSGLTRITADGTPALDLAEAWEVTPDGLTYTFTLLAGVTWHDGVPFGAHDVAYTIERIQAEDFRGAPGLAAEWRSVQVFVADERTVLIRLPEPAADLLVRASLGLVPRHLDDQMRPGPGFEVAPFDRFPVGTGPYRLVSLDERRAVLERHVDYAHGAPALPIIELRFAQDGGEQLALLRRGEADAALLGELAAEPESDALAARDDLATTLLPRSAYTILYFNTLRGPLDEPALRRALAASIDREAALAAVDAGRFEGGDGVIIPGSWAYEREAAAPATVEELWDASGWERGARGMRVRDGTTLSLELITNSDPHREAVAAVLAEQLRAQGVEVDVVPVPAGRLIADHLRPGDYQLALFGWEAGLDLDPYAGWHTSQVGGSGGNVAGFQDVESDALLEAARTTLDVAERRELYALFARRFADQAPSLVIGYPKRLYAHPENLRGLEAGLLFSPASRFRDVHRWELR